MRSVQNRFEVLHPGVSLSLRNTRPYGLAVYVFHRLVRLMFLPDRVYVMY